MEAHNLLYMQLIVRYYMNILHEVIDIEMFTSLLGSIMSSMKWLLAVDGQVLTEENTTPFEEGLATLFAMYYIFNL